MVDVEYHGYPQTIASDSLQIVYAYGGSPLGDFLAAVDAKGLCAVIFGNDRGTQLANLHKSFPGKTTGPASPILAAFVVGIVNRIIQHPSAVEAVPLSIAEGDFGQMVRAALSLTKPGTTKTPAEVVALIKASPGAEDNVRKHAANDVLAVAVPFHRLQEEDGTSPAYRWGEDRRQQLLAHEAASRRSHRYV